MRNVLTGLRFRTIELFIQIRLSCPEKVAAERGRKREEQLRSSSEGLPVQRFSTSSQPGSMDQLNPCRHVNRNLEN
jgi:hypothetical protein